jgi:trypsin-like peptidase
VRRAVLLAVLVVGCRAGAATREMFDKHGISFMHPQGWTVSDGAQLPAPRFAHAGSAAARPDTYRVTLSRADDPRARIEVVIGEKPAVANIGVVLDLDRRVRWGEQVATSDVSQPVIADVVWRRTAYRAGERRAVEYATVDRSNLYVVTAFADGGQLDDIDELLANSLRRTAQPGAPLASRAPPTLPDPITRAVESAVVVAAADMIDGRLRVTGIASGTVVGRNGSVLTLYDTLFDKQDRPHDLYLLGKGELVCAGSPQHGKQLRDADLVLVQCETDFDGRPFAKQLAWPVLANAQLATVRTGARLWALGVPETDAQGSTGELRTIGPAYFATDLVFDRAASGGPVVDERGRLVGIAARYARRVAPTGDSIDSQQLGRVRSIGTAAELLDVAVLGWKASERSDTAIELSEPKDTGSAGVRVSTHVLDAQRRTPIADARVIALQRGIVAASLDANVLDGQTLTWGLSNAEGAVELATKVPPGSYTVVALAPGYEPFVGDGVLVVADPDAPRDPNAPPVPPPPALADVLLRAR